MAGVEKRVSPMAVVVISKIRRTSSIAERAKGRAGLLSAQRRINI
jgi:hypothetical protein